MRHVFNYQQSTVTKLKDTENPNSMQQAGLLSFLPETILQATFEMIFRSSLLSKNLNVDVEASELFIQRRKKKKKVLYRSVEMISTMDNLTSKSPVRIFET